MKATETGIKIIGKVLCFLLIFVMLFFAVQAVMTPKWRTGSEAETDKMALFYDLPNDTLDYLIVGTSPAYFGLSPMMIYAKTGIVGYDLGNARQSIVSSYYLFKEALKTQSPKIVFWDVSSLFSATTTAADVTRTVVPLKFSKNKIEMIRNDKRESQSFSELLFPIIQFHDRWESLSAEDFILDNAGNYFLAGAHISFSSNLSSNKDRRTAEYDIYDLLDDGSVVVSESEIAVRDESAEYFEKVVAICQENNIELIPFRGPTMSWGDEWDQNINEYLSQFGLSYLNMTLTSDISYAWGKDTSDFGYHVNYWGSSKASDYLAEYLQTKGLEDHRGQKDYAIWDKDLQKYLSWEENNLLDPKQQIYKYLSALADIKNDSVIIVTVKDEASGAWNDKLEAAMYEVGVTSSFYNQGQNSFVCIIDGGENKFELWDDKRITVNSDLQINDEKTIHLSVSSAGFMCGNISEILIDGTNYSLNNRGLNIAVIDKADGKVISSVSVDTHVAGLTFNQRSLPGDQSARWQAIYDGYRAAENGTYVIRPAKDTSYGLGNLSGDGNICITDDASEQIAFDVEYIGDELYTLRDVASGQYLAIENMGSTAGSNVALEEGTGLANQKWYIRDNGSGRYSFISLYNGQYLDLSGGVLERGTNIQVWSDNGQMPQRFLLEPAA